MVTHLKIEGDAEYHTEYEREHQAACGYTRDNITSDESEVTCQDCLDSDHMTHWYVANRIPAGVD